MRIRSLMQQLHNAAVLSFTIRIPRSEPLFPPLCGASSPHRTNGPERDRATARALLGTAAETVPTSAPADIFTVQYLGKRWALAQNTLYSRLLFKVMLVLVRTQAGATKHACYSFVVDTWGAKKLNTAVHASVVLTCCGVY